MLLPLTDMYFTQILGCVTFSMNTDLEHTKHPLPVKRKRYMPLGLAEEYGSSLIFLNFYTIFDAGNPAIEYLQSFTDKVK